MKAKSLFQSMVRAFLMIVSILMLLFSVLGVTPVRAATIRYATPTGAGDCAGWATACTLQTALADAGSGDEIWVAAGTHKPTTGTDRAATFQLKSVSIYGGFAGTETARDQRDFTANVTILSGEIGAAGNSDNSYHVVTGADGAILDGFIITAGNANGSSFNNSGGGMYNDTGSPALANIIFSDNSATYYGGGMYNSAGSPTLTNVTFSGNSGCGMYNSGNPTLTNVTFSGNSATNGGGMSNSGNPTLTNVTFSNNSAVSSINMGFGGGMYNGAGSPTLTNVTFSDNSARYGGGGMYNGAGSPTLTNVTFSGNSASEGGGMYTGPMFDLSTFSGNSATTSGGGMNNTIGGLTLTNVTFNGNSASEGCGMYNFVSNSTTIRNTIFWGNAGAQISNSCATSVISDSVIQGGCPAGSTCTNIITTSPMLGPLGNYGGPSTGSGQATLTIPLLTGSSAIDAGDDTVCPATDQRGVPRPQGAHCDIGAYEVDNTAPAVVANARADPNPTSATSVGFTVTFSEPVTGVDTGDFSLTTSGVTGASISSVSGSGATYKVNVNTGSGNGAIRLDIPASATITDLAGNSLASLPYTGGQVYTVNKIATLTSIATQDGWILELSENSNVGGAMNNTTTTLRLGDNVARGQYLGILSFSTGASLPDNAVITGVTLKVQKSAIVGGGNPVTMFGGFMVDIKNGFLGAAATLQAGDFQAAGSKTYGPFAPAPVSNWYSMDLTGAKAYVNKLAAGSGLTQIRLRFKLDDNNNTVANYLSLFSGDAPAAARPQLVITYYVP